MSSAAERTEEATPRRRQEARREGRVAKSADLCAAACITISGAGLMLMAGTLPHRILELARSHWSNAAQGGPRSSCLETAFDASCSSQGPREVLVEGLSLVASLVMPVALLSAAVGALATICQVGPLIAPKVVRPDVKRMSPVAGAKRLFAVDRLLVIARAMVALSLTLTVVWSLTRAEAATILSMPAGSPEALATLLGGHLPLLLVLSGATLVLPGAIDLVMAKRRLAKSLRMTKKEVRDEHKRDEGDPEHKGKRREAHRELSATPARPLEDAKVLIVNPTHIAVALHHDVDLAAPEVGARGRGERAALLRKQASRLGIPIVRDVPLARALIAVEPGKNVPEKLYSAVAAVLAAIYRAELNERL